MTITKLDLDTKWQPLFLHCKNSITAKEEILTLLSEEPGESYEWSEQDIYEQMRKIIMKYE